MMESACPACGQGRAGRSVEVNDHEYGLDVAARFAECDLCGTHFQVPMPSLEELAGYYPDDYHSFSGNRVLTRIRHGMRIKRLTPLLTGPGAVLDFGCGAGQFLVQAAEQLPDEVFYGYEINDHDSVEKLCDGRVTIVRGNLDGLWQHLPQCRVITLNHVIEHLPDPLATVSMLFGKLVSGGVLEGQTPAGNAFERTVFGRRWSGFHAPRHTVVFSPQGLRRLLGRVGFSRVTIKAAFNPASWAVSVGSALHGPGPARLQRKGPSWLCLLALGSLPFGIGLGAFFCWALAWAYETDLYRFPFVLRPETMLMTAVIVIGFTLLANMVVQRRVRRLDLIEVLKARE